MESEGSLPVSRKLTIGPYPEPDESSSHRPTPFSTIHLNIDLPSTLRCSEWSLPLRFSDLNFVCICDSEVGTDCNVQGRTLPFQNDKENKCGVLRTSHLHQTIEQFSKLCAHLTETRYVLRESHGRCRDDNPTRLKLCSECPS
jgi:hypothetical protein